MPPPIWVRRLVIAPAVVLLAVVLLTTLPVWLLLALAASPLVPGHLRVPRLVFLAVVYVVWDAAALVVLAVLWMADMARRAERLRNVLPPKPGGLFAAIDAAPDAGVIFVAHTGLDRMMTMADIWHELPMDKQLTMRFWSVPPEVPAGEDERVAWLYDWWARIDAWIEENRPAVRPLGTDWTARRSSAEV